MEDFPRLFFDEFEFRLDSGELFRDGVPVVLQPQPARVLALLASRSGEVVTRDEIRQLVWGESFVDFDASLNFCVKQIRRALEDSAISPRYLETLPRRGYRFLRPVRNGAAAVDGPPGPEPTPEPPPRRFLGGSLAAVAAGLVVLVILLIASRSRTAAGSHPRLAVLPLTCRGTATADRQICGGVTDALTAELTRQLPRDVEVIAPTSLLAYQGSRKTDREVGRALGASYLLAGEVEPSGGVLRIKARLTQVDGEALWNENVETELAEAPFAYLQVVRGVAGALRLPLPAIARPAAKPRTEAYEAYLKGRYLSRMREYDSAVASLEEAVLLDDQFARAYAELSLARVLRDHQSKENSIASRAAARRAVALDPLLADGHLALGEVLFRDRLDWRQAGAEFRRALALGPGDANIHYSYALYLTALGRHGEAVDSMERARELDPASMAVNSDYAWILYLARRYDESIQQAKTALTLLDMTRGSLPKVAQYGRSWSYYSLVHSWMKKGDDARVLEAVKQRLRETGNEALVSRMRSVRDVSLFRWEEARKNPDSSYGLAFSASELGRIEEALEALERQCRNGGEDLMFNFVAVEPTFDPLHGDPRFARVVDCAGMPGDAPARRGLTGHPRPQAGA